MMMKPNFSSHSSSSFSACWGFSYQRGYPVYKNALHHTQLLYINVQRFRGGLVVESHRLLHHSNLGLRVITLKKVEIH